MIVKADDKGYKRSISIYFERKKPSDLPEKEEGTCRQCTLEKLPKEVVNSLEPPETMKSIKITEINFTNANSEAALESVTNALYNILAHDKKLEYVNYPDEGHVFEQPKNQRDALERTIKWIDEHMGWDK